MKCNRCSEARRVICERRRRGGWQHRPNEHQHRHVPSHIGEDGGDGRARTAQNQEGVEERSGSEGGGEVDDGVERDAGRGGGLDGSRGRERQLVRPLELMRSIANRALGSELALCALQ